jgi:hypothetical protein
MIDLGLDPLTNDLEIVGFDLTLVKDRDQIAQNLGIRLAFVLAEWYLDITAGIPYYQEFFIKAPNQIQIESVLMDEITNTRGVKEILAFSSAYNATGSDARTFTVNFQVNTVAGNLQIEQELP